MIRILRLLVPMIALGFANPAVAQQPDELRAQLIDLLSANRPPASWARLKLNPQTPSVLISIAGNNGNDVTIRRAANNYLARLDDPIANAYVERIIRAGVNPSNDQSIAIIAGLPARPDSVALHLVRFVLEQGDYHAQLAGVYTLGQMQNHPPALELLRSILAHPDPRLRAIAANLLSREK